MRASGADGLCHDPLGGFTLTPEAIGECLKFVKDSNIPLLVLGGGGYHHANTSRCWAYLTGILTGTYLVVLIIIIYSGITLDQNIPDHDFFHKYGPDFSLRVQPANQTGSNQESLKHIKEKVLANLDRIKPKAG